MKWGGGIASAAPIQNDVRLAYFIAEETLLKVDLRLVPTPCMAAIAATAMRAAIRPYSMAVAPLLLLISLRMNCMFRSPGSASARGGPHLLAPARIGQLAIV